MILIKLPLISKSILPLESIFRSIFASGLSKMICSGGDFTEGCSKPSNNTQETVLDRSDLSNNNFCISTSKIPSRKN